MIDLVKTYPLPSGPAEGGTESLVPSQKQDGTDLAPLPPLKQGRERGIEGVRGRILLGDPMTVSSTALIPYSTLLQQFKAAPPGKLYCLHGAGSVFRLSLSAAAHVLLNGVPITLVDGTNHFDVYYIAEFARRTASAGGPSPEELLNNIFISRAFTCYQMEAVITERLQAFVLEKCSPVVIIFGLLDTFYDEQASLSDVRAGVRRIIGTLRQLKQAKISVLLASLDVKPASQERSALFPQVCKAMDEVYAVTEEEGRPRITKQVPGKEALRLPLVPQKAPAYRQGRLARGRSGLPRTM